MYQGKFARDNDRRAKPAAPKAEAAPAEAAQEELQISLGGLAGNDLVERLRKLEPEVLTPIEAMNLLFELHKQAKEC